MIGRRSSTQLALRAAALLLATACTVDPPEGSSQVAVQLGRGGPGDVDSRFPLQVGNVWHFAGEVLERYGGPQRSFVNSVRVVGQGEVGGVPALVVRESAPGGEAVPEDSYYAPDAAGVALLDGPPDAAVGMALGPYWELRFPLEVGSRFHQVSRRGADLGEDLDGDGVHERVDVHAVVHVAARETVDVPAGRFEDCARVETDFHVDVVFSSDGSRSRATGRRTTWLAPGVGWVKRAWSFEVEGGDALEETEQLVAWDVNGRAGATELRVAPSSLLLGPLGSGRLQAVAYSPEGVAFDLGVTWSTNAPDVVRLPPGIPLGGPRGEVTVLGIGGGTALLTAALGDVLVSDVAEVTVAQEVPSGADPLPVSALRALDGDRAIDP